MEFFFKSFRILTVFSLLFLALSAKAVEIKEPSSQGILIGYGYGERLTSGKDYIHHLLAFNFSYPFEESGFWKNFQFQVEPFVSYLSSPEQNGELGCVFFIKYTLPLNCFLKPYIRGGSGLILLSQETREQSTLFNFASQIGYGLSYSFGDSSIYVERRNRHISNWFLGEPNSGIDTYIWLFGIEKRF